MDELLVGLAEMLDEPGHALGVRGIVAEEIRRDAVEERTDELLDPCGVVPESLHPIDIGLGVPGDLGAVDRRIRACEEVVAIVHRSEVRPHVEGHEAEAHEVELGDDLRAEQAQCVGERREVEAGPELLRDRRPTDEVALLEHEDALARLGEVGGVGEAVVTATDDDCVVGMGVGHVRPSSSRGCRTAASSPSPGH